MNQQTSFKQPISPYVVGSRNTSLKYIGLLWDLSPLVSPKSNHLFLGPLSAIPKKKCPFKFKFFKLFGEQK